MISAFSATRWVLFGSFGFRILAYLGQMVILRIVAKEVFGAYGALVDLHLMSLALLPMAFDALLIREKHRRRRYAVGLAMALAIIATFLIGLVVLSLSVPGFGSESVAAGLLGAGGTWAAVAFMVPIFAVMATKLSVRSLLSADLNFRRISIGEFGNGIITYFGGAAAILFHPDAWALMAAYLLGEMFECFWLYRGHAFRPFAVLAPRRWKIFKTLYMRHRKFLLTNTADLTLNNVGSLIPGPLILALISEAASADFRAARMLIQLPILLLVGAIWRVAYPTISGVAEDVLQSRCLKIIGTTAAFLVPGVIWLAFFSASTVVVLGGERYATAAPLIQWMAVYMALTAIFSPISTLDMIRDKSEWGLYWNIVHTAARIGVIVYFAPMGLLYTIAAMSITSFLLWILWAYMLAVLLGAGIGKFFYTTFRFVPGWGLLALAFAGCLWLTGGNLLMAPLLSIVPGVIYLVLVMRLYPNEAQMIRRLLRR